MKKKLLNQLISYSYKKNILNPENVNSIAKLLSKKDLKYFIEALKRQEKKLTVFIDVPMNMANNKDKFRNILPNKKIVWNTVPSLMLGARITADDMLLDINLKNTLDKMLLFIEEDYD